MRVTVVDSGVGNIPNAVRGLERAGAEVAVTGDPGEVELAVCLVLPGVGSFPAGMARLVERGLDAAIRRLAARGVPVLGICLGHQMLFEASSEFGETPGLGLLPGRVGSLPATARVPHMGWDRLEVRRPDPLLSGLDGGAWMYFVHSFVAEPEDADLIAAVDFSGALVCAAARRGNVVGVQFHPEKSGPAGARLLANFLECVG